MSAFKRNGLWIVAWLVFSSASAYWLALLELDRLRIAFETDARIVHRLLSQRVVQHDAVLAMLALLQPGADAAGSEQRLASVYPQIVGVQRIEGSTPREAAVFSAQTASRSLHRPVLVRSDLARGHYQLVLAAYPASYAIDIDVRTMVPWSDWPMARETSRVTVALEHSGRSLTLQPGQSGTGPAEFDFRKRLAADSQPFGVVATRQVFWSELPWFAMLASALAIAAALAALRAIERQRLARRRAEELLRLDRVARLNALGELAAGLAHELNQPLTAVMANTQAASRLLSDDPPELATARDAMGQAVEQARRASQVVSRMRAAIDRPERPGDLRAVNLEDAVRHVLYLLQPECEQRGVTPVVETSAQPIAVSAEPVALEQIVHNLLSNALQALDQVPPRERWLKLVISESDGRGVLTVCDSGPGIAAAALPRIFDPFFTTRENGLGLGLSLCESLAGAMHGSVSAANRAPRGAELSLTLPLAQFS